jgi:Methylmalonyl-CoA mutase
MSNTSGAKSSFKTVSESEFERDTNAQIEAFYERSLSMGDSDECALRLGVKHVYTAASSSGKQLVPLREKGGWLITAGTETCEDNLHTIANSYAGAGAELLEVNVSKDLTLGSTPSFRLPLLVRARAEKLPGLLRDLRNSGHRVFGVLCNPFSMDSDNGTGSASDMSHIASILDVDSTVPRPCSVDVSDLIDNGLSIERALIALLFRVNTCAVTFRNSHLTGFELPHRTVIGWATGMSLFGEIAALRALRLLVPEVFRSWGYSAVCPHVHVITSTVPLTGLCADNNLIRTTIQSIAAILGGCDSLRIRRHDSLLESESGNLASDLLALSTQHLLRHEAHLDRIGDPTAGAYYVEQYTQKLALNAWEGFLEIVSRKSTADSFESDTLPDWVETDRAARASRATGGSDAVVGINRYPSVLDDEQASADAFVGTPWHSAQDIEVFRSGTLSRRKEATGRTDCLLIPYGGSASGMRSVTFARNFLLCGGFSLETGPRLEAETLSNFFNRQRTSDSVLFCGSAEDLGDSYRTIERGAIKAGFSLPFGFASDVSLSDTPCCPGTDFPCIDPETPLLSTLERILTILESGREVYI